MSENAPEKILGTAVPAPDPTKERAGAGDLLAGVVLARRAALAAFGGLTHSKPHSADLQNS